MHISLSGRAGSGSAGRAKQGNLAMRLLSCWTASVLLISSLLSSPVTVQAQLATMSPVQDPIAIQEKIAKEVQKPLGVALLQILINLISFVANRLAYDAAMAIASGGKGQGPNFEYRTPEEYWQDIGQDIAGESIGILSDTVKSIGINFDVCAPTAPEIRLSIQLGIAAGPGSNPRQPRCDFNQIKGNWEGFVARARTAEHPNKEIMRGMASMFSPGATQLDSALRIVEQTANRAAKKQVLDTDEMLSNDRFKNVEDFITGRVKTPSTVLEDQFKNKLNAAQDNQSDALQSALFSNEGALLQVGVSAGSVFLNTLLSQLTNKIYSGLFNPPAGNGVWNPEYANVGGRELARETLKGLFTTSIQTIDQFNIVNQFVTCPGANRTINNCVMDTPLAAAIARAGAGSSLTIREAMNANLLHGNWPLISSRDEARNTDPFCYTYGYCEANLVKMRAARILPVGWELAAESLSNNESAPVTLREVVDGFYDCNWENPNQLVDAEHPWCHLIDPNWVIAYPETMCRAQVPGQTLIAANADARAQTCVDAPSCIAEDDQGNCVGGYGYCLREQNTWRFGGDSCPVQYASCVAMTSRAGEQVSYLTNTVDFSGCDASNAGCMWYTTQAERQGGEDAIANNDDDTFSFVDSGTPTVGDRLYLDAEVAACAAGDAGCTGMVLASVDETLNLVTNPNLEEDADNNQVPDGWVFVPGSGTATWEVDASSAAFDMGSVVLSSGAEMALRDPITLPANRFLSISFYEQEYVAGNKVNLVLKLYRPDGSAYPSEHIVTPPGSACDVSSSSAGYALVDLMADADTTFTRFSCTLSLSSGPARAELSMLGTGRVDAVQIEENDIPTVFHEAYSPTVENVAIKLAPDYLGCTGAATDHPLCANYAQVCTAAEVGCTAYAPLTGGPTVPGIINETDQCPTECIGYETHRQLATNFSVEAFPLYFIPSTAQSCSAQYVGCEEFTDVTGTGESRAYFSGMRACQTVEQAANSNGAQNTFYTWEGADVTGGYQIKTWTLKKSNISNAPCVSFDPTTGACTEASTYSSPGDCNAHEDIITNPDCREFFDSTGATHYRLYSQTISVSDECHGYRKTNSNASDCSKTGGVWNAGLGACSYSLLPSESQSCPAAQNGCRAYVGNAGNNMRLVVQEVFEDGNLNAWPRITGTTPIYSNESLATGGHSLRLTNNGSRTVASVSAGQFLSGYTYTASFWAKGQGNLAVSLRDANGSGAEVPLSTGTGVTLSGGWQEYTVGPVNPSLVQTLDWATTVLTVQMNGTEAYVDNISVREVVGENYLIAGSWNTPSTCNQTAQGAPAPQFYLGCREYNSSAGDRVSLKSFSSLCREQSVGCSAIYTTENSASPYAESYAIKCSAAAAVSGATACTMNGAEVCTILAGQSSCRFNWQGELPVDLPITPYRITVESDSALVPHDSSRYLVDSPGARCGRGAEGCTLLGLPNFDETNTTVESFTEVTKRILPDTFASVLCASDDLFCEAYTSKTGTSYFFKNPGDRTCEFRDRVVIGGTPYSGWFQTGGDTPCDDEYTIAGTQYGIWRNGDDDYSGWVGQCPAKQDQCAEFLDVADTQGGELPRGTSYTFVKNDRINETNRPAAEKCEGQISQEQGCVAFNDTSNPTFTMNASASYIKSRHADSFGTADPFSRVTPVSCPDDGTLALQTADDGSVDLCRKRCAYVLTTNYDADGNSVVDIAHGGSCMMDADCGTMRDSFGAERPGVCLQTSLGTNEVTINELMQTSLPNMVQDGLCLPVVDASSVTPTDRVNGSYTLTSNTGVSVCDADSTNTCASGYVCEPVLAPTLVNDSNTVIKVNKDRTCSEWLACDAQYTTWSQEQNRYVTVCESVDVCNEYTQVGDTSFCSNWPDTPEQVLTEAVYATRDVTWYGQEYAGYSIPGSYNVKDYDQVNVNPSRWCHVTGYATPGDSVILNADGEPTAWVEAETDWSDGVPMECQTQTDCDDMVVTSANMTVECELATPDYRLAVHVGPCLSSTEDGNACTVGYCAQTGVACASTSDCGTSEACVLVSAQTKVGKCYDGQCMQTTDGNPLTRGNSSVNECRGYPEDTSPFPNEVVTEWNDPTTHYDGTDQIAWTRTTAKESVMDLEQRSLGRQQGFSQAKICANGESCDCSYKKAEYGGGTRSLYTDLDGTDGNTPPAGLCSGGPYDGFACTNNAECQSGEGPSASGGMCEFKTTENTFVGWNGFCVQRDGSTSILGNKDKSACLLWLPVDKLRGSTDIYNKFTEAGFPVNNTAYCTETKLYADLYVTGAVYNSTNSQLVDSVVPACAESFRGNTVITEGEFPEGVSVIDPIVALILDGAEATARENPWSDDSAEGDCEQDEWDSCWYNVRCPKNYFAILGGCDESEDDAGSCTIESGADDDCPYICVPDGAKASVSSTDSNGFQLGEECVAPTGTQLAGPAITGTGGLVVGSTSITWSTPIYLVDKLIGGGHDYPAEYQHCVKRGVSWLDENTDINWPEDNYYLPQEPDDTPMIRDFSNRAQFYLGCAELAFTSVEEGYSAGTDMGNAAFTNRTLSPGELFSMSDAGMLGYNADTVPVPVGRIPVSLDYIDPSESRLGVGGEDEIPVRLAACQGSEGQLKTTETDTTSCDLHDANTSTNFAKAYDYASYTMPGGVSNARCTSDSDCTGAAANSSGSPATCNDNTPQDGGDQDYACFIACDEFAMQYNPAAAAYADADAFCAGEVHTSSTCILAPENYGSASSSLYGVDRRICSKWYGISSGNPQGNFLMNATDTCNAAETNGVIPFSEGANTLWNTMDCLLDNLPGVETINGFNMSTLCNGGNPSSSRANPFAWAAFQCDGGVGADAACRVGHDEDCPASVNGGGPGAYCVLPTGSDADAFGFCSGSEPASVFSQVLPIRASSLNTHANAVTRLQQFFAKIYAFWSWNDEAGLDVEDGTGAYGERLSWPDDLANITPVDDKDLRDNDDELGEGPNDGTPTAPTIAAVTDVCVGDACVEGDTNNFSINGNAGTIFEGENSFRADVRFYAWTDPNQYPLRKILVDWGDGMSTDEQGDSGSLSGSITNDNYYKAHRGLDNASQEPICTNDTDPEVEWGRTSDSCTSDAFQFTHHYRCTPGLLNWINSTGRICEQTPGDNRVSDTGPCTFTGDSCVFQPRVYVEDNWGYCAGTCTDGNNEVACYDSTNMPIEGIPNSGGRCLYDRLPTIANNSNDPWVYYNGYIDVTP